MARWMVRVCAALLSSCGNPIELQQTDATPELNQDPYQMRMYFCPASNGSIDLLIAPDSFVAEISEHSDWPKPGHFLRGSKTELLVSDCREREFWCALIQVRGHEQKFRLMMPSTDMLGPFSFSNGHGVAYVSAESESNRYVKTTQTIDGREVLSEFVFNPERGIVALSAELFLDHDTNEMRRETCVLRQPEGFLAPGAVGRGP